MKINFKAINGSADEKLMYNHLISFPAYNPSPSFSIFRGATQTTKNGFFDVDLVGQDLIWANKTFTDDKFVWYHWFESVFVVPENMYALIKLKLGAR